MFITTDLKITVLKQDILDNLARNKDHHEVIFKEAQHGYLKEAEKQLLADLERIQANQIGSVHISLKPPESMHKTYSIYIGLFKAAKENEFLLDVGQYRMFFEDEWDWAKNRYAEFSKYSASGLMFYSDKYSN